MNEEHGERQVETCGTFLHEELGLVPEEVRADVADRTIELLEATGLLPALSPERESEMRFELRHLHRSAAIIRRVASALELPQKEKTNEE
jgi:hypothetical protein